MSIQISCFISKTIKNNSKNPDCVITDTVLNNKQIEYICDSNSCINCIFRFRIIAPDIFIGQSCLLCVNSEDIDTVYPQIIKSLHEYVNPEILKEKNY